MEGRISLILCVLLCLTGTSFLPGPQVARGIEAGIDGSYEEKVVSTGLDSLIPEDDAVEGWRRDGSLYGYGPDDLWEYIDGAAETYIAYEFDTLLIQNYESEDGRALKVEIYVHRTPPDAFGIYSMYRSPELTFLEIGKEACCDDYSLHMWKGRFYIHLSVFEKSPILAKAMKNIARIIASRIDDNRGLPDWVERLPYNGMVPYSLSYIRGGILGRGFFPPSFSAEYRLRHDGNVRVYVSCLSDSIAAGDMVERFVKSGFKIIGEEFVEEKESGAGSFTLRGHFLEHRYAGKIFVTRSDRWIVVIAGFEGGLDTISSLLKRIVEGVRNRD